ncbi:type ISP restriction/modification enzyme [Flavobacterium gilvum]|uniref:Type ISP restriction-modification enzyme LLaBIII C-terminal specificity domain-containing protein n=1 Tax=Flavobacterium gilvum TaxID=1492737 RepID=A0AAC9I2X5_9FLAO|nr:type ISP restriction/modification enzyme [Flavobacterium gilvum]AOW09211.1 hypothetical protein EM308_06640 [Flavobacterium gilvum]KFC58184.1 hypothetical protein FEM08_30410 [Flavobacterium gilvum]
MNPDSYLSDVNSAYKLGIATELFDGRMPDLTQEIIIQMENSTGLNFLPIKNLEGNVCMANNREVRPEFRQNFSALDILNYMCAILYSTSFRLPVNNAFETKFKYPKDADFFWILAELGAEIKEIHSLKKIKDTDSFFEFCNSGNAVITNPHFEIFISSEKNLGCVYINEKQYFKNVSESVWTFTIQNHQPAQKWLDQRLGQKLNSDDINYYKKILCALSETERLIQKIDAVLF